MEWWNAPFCGKENGKFRNCVAPQAAISGFPPSTLHHQLEQSTVSATCKLKICQRGKNNDKEILKACPGLPDLLS
jgi:hypothetical protein